VALRGPEIDDLEGLIGKVRPTLYQFRSESRSITKTATWFPLLTVVLWLLVLVVMAVASS
jgi:hypothetical protein